MATSLTPLGELLERARGSVSQRHAAAIAGISEGRWRQVVTGIQKAGRGVEVPARPRRTTVIQMARAVGVPVNQALEAAGFEPEPVERLKMTPAEFRTLLDMMRERLDRAPFASDDRDRLRARIDELEADIERTADDDHRAS